MDPITLSILGVGIVPVVVLMLVLAVIGLLIYGLVKLIIYIKNKRKASYSDGAKRLKKGPIDL